MKRTLSGLLCSVFLVLTYFPAAAESESSDVAILTYTGTDLTGL